MFVVYLSTNKNTKALDNYYGYYRGKCYTKDGEIFPITDRQVIEVTKQYTSRNKAIKGAEAVYNKCGYVLAFEIEEV